MAAEPAGVAEELNLSQTFYAIVDEKEKALVMGCTGCIEKPINPDTIIKDSIEYL